MFNIEELNIKIIFTIYGTIDNDWNRYVPIIPIASNFPMTWRSISTATVKNWTLIQKQAFAVVSA